MDSLLKKLNTENGNRLSIIINLIKFYFLYKIRHIAENFEV